MPPEIHDVTDEEQHSDNLGIPFLSNFAITLEITIANKNNNVITSDKTGGGILQA